MTVASSAHEQVLIRIVRTLPPERVSQIVDFARFIAAQSEASHADVEMADDETEDEIRASEARWDALLAKPESQHMLIQMAQEALAEDEAGLTVEMAFDNDDNLIEPA